MADSDSQNDWWKNPSWWNVVLSAIEILVISLVGGSIGFIYRKTSENQATRRQIDLLRTGLASPDPATYNGALSELVSLGASGKAAVLNYVRGTQVSCIAWPKARILAEEVLRFSQSAQEREATAKLVWNSYSCRPPNIGRSVEFYEFMKEHSSIACPAVTPQINYAENSLLGRAQLLALVERACPTTTSRELRDLRGRFETELKPLAVTQPYTLSTVILVTLPWMPYRTEPEGPFQAKYDSWREVVYGSFDLFRHSGPLGGAVMWQEAGREPLWSRLLFGQLILRLSSETYFSKEDSKRFDGWVADGLRSVDRQARFEAVKAVGTLKLTKYRSTLQRLALSDADAAIRQLADSIVTNEM